ncbi:DNA polymerase III subunit gamma and tau [Nocardioides panacis]|uniref:DNA polymerase III subunit gamma/tau n=1 Tax=Nocardioides panacis TaxID=2849501 RepID=A0A975SX40_9ACTN|nr:DNA polymerase III subunit gamma and tau [Nocardioides panacis]QWZ07481.1 DNA polymerase III subunit gamma and tau [Nocardioides panacis]
MEAPLALYRRYRPETFAEVIGQEHVTTPLRAALNNNRVNHAYLFSGPRGCGKTTSARILARCLNCEQGPTDDPCGVCRSCTDLARGGPGSIDVIEIDAASHGGVDDARDLRERAFFAPVSSRYKVYIIDEAHMVTPQGFNALLKLVEEPPEHLKFVFATTEPEKVIGTIRSRTHHYPFRLIPPRTLSDYLRELCTKEGVEVDAAALPLVVRAGGGSARDTLSVLDQLMGGAGPEGVTYELATGLLGFTPDTLLDEVVDAFAAGDGATVFGAVDKVIETGQDPRRFTEDLLRRLRDLVIISAVPDAPATGLIDVPQDQGERLTAQAARFGRADLSRSAELVADGLTELKGATAPRLLLELICARVLLPGAYHGTEGVMARLDRIEKRMAIEGVPSAAAAPRAPAPQPVARPVQAAVAAPEPPAVEPVETTPVPRPPVVEPVVAASETRVVEPVHTAPEAAPESAVVEPVETAPEPAPAAAGTSSGLGLVDVRRLWPDLLEAVKLKRRYTWILLSQNGQVVAVDDKTMTVALVNAGARNSFTSGGSEEILRQAAIDVIGHDWRIEAIVDPSAQPGAEPPLTVTRPAVAEQPAPPERPAPPTATAPEAAPRRPVDPESIATARGAIQDTRPAGNPRLGPPDDSDEHAHRDDPDADDHSLGGAQLLERELGASIIEEIKHD